VTPALPLHTERLTLRRAVETDFDDLYSYYSQPGVCRYLLFDAVDEEGMQQRLARFMRTDEVADDADLPWQVVVEHEGRVIGDLVLWLKGPAPRSMAEIGWVFHPDAAGRGFATEAARALIDLAFTSAPLHRIFAQLDARNDASAQLCERLGMQREGYLRENYLSKGEWTDTLYYGLLRADWAALRD